ncbi:MAG: hypothetical protein GYB64_00865 [Chloroflexi bacterium]|nr:hypothetical protein [Chloroflexota bacterium]
MIEIDWLEDGILKWTFHKGWDKQALLATGETYRTFYPELDRPHCVIIDMSESTKLPSGVLGVFPSVARNAHLAPRRADHIYVIGASHLVHTLADIFAKHSAGTSPLPTAWKRR